MKDETIVSKDKVISEMNKDISSKEAEIIKLRDELASHDKVGTQLETEIAPEESLNTVELVGRDMLLLTVKEEIISSNYEKFEEAESELQTSMDTEDSMDEDDDDFMIQCDAPNCGKWVSALDLSPPITPQQADEYEKYHCDECIPYHGPSTLYTRRSGLRMMKRIHYGNERESKYTECRSRGTNGFEAKVRAMSLSEAIPFRIAEKNTELASNNKEIEYKENEIARLRELEAQLKSDLNKQHSEIEAKEEAIKSKEDAISRLKFDLRNKRSSTRMSIQEKDKQIASLKAEIASLTTVCPPFKRRRTGHQPKVLTLQLGHEYSSCGICHSKYSTDTKNKDNDVKKHLPVISASSKSCDHCFCHGCILKQQAAIAEENGGKVPKWIPCMVCRTKTAFCPSEPKYHRMLIDILKQAKWADNEAEVKVKEEAKPNNNDEIPARDEMLLSMKEYEEGTAEEVQGYHF